MRFKVGDLVYITKPKDPEESPSWTGEMSILYQSDKIYTIRAKRDSSIGMLYEVDASGYVFSPRWLTLVTEPPRGKYWQVINKIKQMEQQRKEQGHVF